MARRRNGAAGGTTAVAKRERRRPKAKATRPQSAAISARGVATAESGRPLRAPQQERGQRRVEEILDAAEHVIADVGIEGASTNAIAERAAASMGSLYHFFPSKEAIICALGDRYARTIQAENAAATLEKFWAPLPELFDRIVDGKQRFMESTPAFGPVHDAIARRFGRDGAFFSQLEQAILAQIVTFLSVRLPRMPAELREASARLAYTVVHAAIESAGALPSDKRKALLTELKHMLVRYYQPLQPLYGPVLDNTSTVPAATSRVKRKRA